jgi:hypothetical protein
LSRLASTFGTNQLQVEHRYFGISVPHPTDWSKLTVRQSAADFHEIVAALKPLYRAHWVNTGRSKGGMTSVYHRRFYPADLDGTLAEVAPLSFALDDHRYVEFLDQVGGDEFRDCRANLYGFQAALLAKRQEIEPALSGSYAIVGGLDVAYEDAVLELPFLFWQYGNPKGEFGCEHIPGRDASVAELADFFQKINGVNSYDDEAMKAFQPYYYQVAAELGGPGYRLSHLDGLLRYPPTVDHLLPKGVRTEFTPATMRDMQSWVATQARRLMFVYGEYDPWSAGAFQAINQSAGNQNLWYLQPKGNHSSQFSSLPEPDRAEALKTLGQWLGKEALSPDLRGIKASSGESLEDLEIRALRSFRLR